MVLDQIEHIADLIDGAIGIIRRRRRPAAPLRTIHGAQIAVLIGPFIPNMHIVFLQPTHVRGPLQEPQQLIGESLEKHRFRGEQRKILAQVESHLLTEQADGARARAIGLQRALRQNTTYQILIRHGNVGFRACRNASTNISKLFRCQSHACKLNSTKSQVKHIRPRVDGSCAFRNASL